jgi:hypothetical protein
MQVVVCILIFKKYFPNCKKSHKRRLERMVWSIIFKKTGITNMADIDAKSQNNRLLDYGKKCCPLNRVHLGYVVIKNVKNRNKPPSSCRE